MRILDGLGVQALAVMNETDFQTGILAAIGQPQLLSVSQDIINQWLDTPWPAGNEFLSADTLPMVVFYPAGYAGGFPPRTSYDLINQAPPPIPIPPNPTYAFAAENAVANFVNNIRPMFPVPATGDSWSVVIVPYYKAGQQMAESEGTIIPLTFISGVQP